MPGTEKLSVRVRMYRHGLGDCFLLTFGRENAHDFNLLIDCGIFFGTKHGKEIMEEVAADISQTTKGRLNAVKSGSAGPKMKTIRNTNSSASATGRY
jgi:hypothetical protein